MKASFLFKIALIALVSYGFFSCSSSNAIEKTMSANIGEDHIRNKCEKVTILYGTDRKIEKKNNPNAIRFSNEPEKPEEKTYYTGFAVVSIPPNHKEGIIETPSIWKLEFHSDTLKHMVLTSTNILSSKNFNDLLKNISGEKDAFIFVHGYNNSFEDAALRTAQLAVDIHLPITPIMFSWSSNNTILSYSGDEENIRIAIPKFKDFLTRIATEGHFQNIHIVGHSMGNRLIAATLTSMQNDSINLHVGQIIMAAPDIFLSDFQANYAEQLAKKCRHITVYSAKNDWALAASRLLHASNLRLGQLSGPPPPYMFNNIDVIDARNQKTDFLGHDRFARSPVIIADMDTLLRTGFNAEQRHIPSEFFQGNNYYYFK